MYIAPQKAPGLHSDPHFTVICNLNSKPAQQIIMCGRYALYADKNTLEREFEITVPDTALIEPDYNVAPGSMRPVVLVRGTVDRVMGRLQWGLVPSFVKDTANWKPLINARSETVNEKPSFRKAFQRRRCIVPANGFYEWKDFGNGKKVPFFIKVLDQDVFGLAGIYETYTSDDGETLHSFALLTTAANALIQPVHDRMPVILRREDYNVWLNPIQPRPEMLGGLMQPYATDQMSAYKVSSRVNNTANNSPELISPEFE